MRLLPKFFKSAPLLPEITDVEEVKAKYKYWRVRIMYSMFTGYVLYYLTRKSFSVAMPGIMEELHLSKGELGLMGSAFALIYGLSKFFSGVLSDQSNPRYFMAFGLIITGVLNLFMGFASSLWVFVLFWGLNGWFQGFGWPPCVKLLSHWYSHSERGSWWSSWAVSQNVGGFITPWFVGICFAAFGWRFAMYAPGIVCILGGLFLMNRLADIPQSLGLPSVEKFRDDYPESKEKEEEKGALSSKEIMLSVFRNKYIWALAIAYFFVYFVRAGVGDWTALYMIEAKGYSRLTANGCVSLVEAGGFLGMLSAGWMSDRLFKAKRGPVNALYAILLFLGLLCFWVVPAEMPWLDSAALAVIGFAIFGPQMLIGVAVAEMAHKSAGATATGFAGWVAYIGSAVAGLPLGYVIDKAGWGGFFTALVVCSIAAVFLLLPLWNITRPKVEEPALEPVMIPIASEGDSTS